MCVWACRLHPTHDHLCIYVRALKGFWFCPPSFLHLQAISRGVTKSAVGVNTYNLETVPLDEVSEAIRKSDGFIIGKSTALPALC